MEKRLKEILQIALRYHVTDIHFDIAEKQQETIAIEMRVHGEMKRLKPHPDDINLFRYLQYLSNLDVSETMRPQTGSFQIHVDDQLLSLRFAIVSSYHIMSGVLRILNNHTDLKIEQLTEEKEDIQWLSSLTMHRTGLILLSGPTGSGKTTSLYTILNAAQGKKIFTLEDPIEVVNDKYVQLQINEKQHLSYADGIKQLMRHDPDILMIGEIRDEVAARMAVRCSLTGHLVLSTLHSSSCIAAIHRMEDLGVPRYQLEDVLTGISCQRLYDTGKAGSMRKTGVYEIMNQKMIQTYFRKGEVSDDFVPLSEKVQRALDRKIISIHQAQSDLAA